eukprot:7451813-Pyramimonas_sp.AAC.2
MHHPIRTHHGSSSFPALSCQSDLLPHSLFSFIIVLALIPLYYPFPSLALANCSRVRSDRGLQRRRLPPCECEVGGRHFLCRRHVDV